MNERDRTKPDILLPPVNPQYIQSELDRRMRSTSTNRRGFLVGAGALIAGAAALHLVGKDDDVAGELLNKDDGPTSEQKEVYQHLVVEKFDIIPDLTLIGVDIIPSKLRNRPFTERREGGYGTVKVEVNKNTWVGDGYVVLGNDPSDQNAKGNKDPWIGVVSPKCNRSLGIKAKDILFSHFGNFKMTDEQYQKFAEMVRRKYGLIWS